MKKRPILACPLGGGGARGRGHVAVDQIEALLGFTQQEYIDDPQLWERMLHPDDRENAVATYLRGRESGEPFVFEYRLIAHDGRTVWFRDSAIVLTVDAPRLGRNAKAVNRK